MKIFISWVGNGRTVASALHDWLPRVLQAAEPFMSEEDIDPGDDWLSEIFTNLRDSQIGIVCITLDSITKPWLNFEAGALTRELEGRTTRIIPYLHGLTESQLQGPLKAFQAATADKSGTLQLIRTINSQLEPPHQSLKEIILRETFELWWPELDKLFSEPPVVETSDISCIYFHYRINKKVRTGNIFQDFRTAKRGEEGDVNAVQWMWADTRWVSELKATTIPDRGVLQVRFKTLEHSYPCNIAIRGKNDSPLENKPLRKYLFFSCRLIKEQEQSVPLAVAIRLVNGFQQNWYMDMAQPIIYVKI